MYANRNISVIAVAPNLSLPLPHQKISYKIAVKLLESLKNSYNSKESALFQLKSECGDGDLLLNDMRKSLFTIRFGAQMLDECNLQPVNETVRILDMHHQTIAGLTSRARGEISQISYLCFLYPFHHIFINFLKRNISCTL